MTLETESAAVLETLPRGPGITITRAADAHPHAGRQQRGADQPGFELHPAIARGVTRAKTRRMFARSVQASVAAS